MSGGFNNQVIGGQSKLIRPAIQSPNYVPGSTGWTINKDGSAEFSNATIRGTVVISGSGQEVFVYSGVPSTGNLILSIAAQAGTDVYGNNFPQGLASYGQSQGGGLFNAAKYSLFSWDASAGPDLILQVLRNSLGSIAATLQSIGNLGLTASGIIDLSAVQGIVVGSGPTGNYYDGTWFIPLQAIPGTGVSTNLTGIGLNPDAVMSDYANAWNAAGTIWTCPVAGPYDIWMSTRIGGAPTQMSANVNKNGATLLTNEMPNPFNGLITVSGHKNLAAGDQLTFSISQNTGANQNTVATGIPYSYVAIARRL